MVRKILFAFILFFSFVLLLPRNSLATKQGYVDCSTKSTCSNTYQKTCAQGCGIFYECGWNCPGCTPDCSGNECGDDGCGGSCGSCKAGENCVSGNCVAPQPSCNTTAPANLAVTRISPTKGTITWTPGANGTEQKIYVGANKTEVDASCPGTGSPACVVIVTGLPTSQTSYTTGDVLISRTVYYWRIVNYKNPVCSSGPASDAIAVSSCSLLPLSASLQTGETTTLTTSVNASSEIQQVTYDSSNNGIATATTPDAASPYETTVTAVSPGSSTVTNNVIIGGATNCSDVSDVTVTAPAPWWQVVDADVATNFDLTSRIPVGQFFGTIGAGGYAGIPSYGGTTNLAAGKISTNGWVAASSIGSTKTFDYNFFSQAVPSDTVINAITTSDIDGSFFDSGGTLSHGFYWYKFDGTAAATMGLDLTITNPASIGNRKVVLLVGSANLALKGNINLTKGQGFFMAIAGKDGLGNKGNISIDSSVGGGGMNLEGIYFADGQIATGTTGTASDSQLTFRGSVSANGGISMQRDLGEPTNTTTPAEVFEYAPDQIMLFPKILGVRKINWKEVAP